MDIQQLKDKIADGTAKNRDVAEALLPKINHDFTEDYLGTCFTNECYQHPSGYVVEVAQDDWKLPRYLTRTEDALMLVPEGYRVNDLNNLYCMETGNDWVVQLILPFTDSEPKEAHHKDLATAIVLAVLEIKGK